MLEDTAIVSLYWERSDRAIEESAAKYGGYCFSLAFNILRSREDAEESVNDTWLAAWNAIPPHRPTVLSTFLGKLTRRIAIDKQRKKDAAKRGGGEYELALEELAESLPAKTMVEEHVEAEALSQFLEQFLKALPAAERKVFLCRYWYFDPIESIGFQFGFSQSKVKMMLFRTRKKLAEALKKEGMWE